MKYFKSMITGAVVEMENAPDEWWLEVTEREYLKYCKMVAALCGKLEKAIEYKARLLGVDP